MLTSKLISVIVVLAVTLSTAYADNPPYYTFTGETAGDEFGFSVAGAGDVDNDGFDDLIVGASYEVLKDETNSPPISTPCWLTILSLARK